MRKRKGIFHHLWRDSLVTLDFYHSGSGIIDTRYFMPGAHSFEIRLSDFGGNATIATGMLQFEPDPSYPLSTPFSQYLGFSGSRAVDPSPSSEQGIVPKINIAPDFQDDYVVFSVQHSPYIEEIRLFLLQPFKAMLPVIKSNNQWIAKKQLIPTSSVEWLLESQITDTSGNTSIDSLIWKMQPILTSGGTVVSEDSAFRAYFAPNALYRTSYARIDFDPSPASPEFQSKIYHLEPQDVPLRSQVRVSISIQENENRPDQLGIYTLSKKGKWTFIDNDTVAVPGAVSAYTPNNDTYVVIRDSEPPTILWLIPPLTTSNRRPQFKLSMKDELSGVDDRALSLRIDGNWLLMEYDFENHRVTGQPEEPLTFGEHLIEVRVKDYNGNEAVLNRTLQIIRP
jgi:hypothetical protein